MVIFCYNWVEDEVVRVHKLVLVKPELEDYWYEQKLNEDKETMSYNAGYDINLEGYDYNTGTIMYPKGRWKVLYDKRRKEKRCFYYIKDVIKDEFVGCCNYQYDASLNRYECGIVIEASKRGNGYSKEGLKLLLKDAFSNNVDKLYDSFEKERVSALKTFLSLGFRIHKETTWKKFGKEVAGVEVSITKDDFLSSLNVK